MKRTILFVDDEVNLIQGLKRSLRGTASEWDLFFAMSGQEALDILAENRIDVIVSDMRMPGMDGGELLETVSERYPQITRFILSGQSDNEIALKSTRVAHQFIAKPCDIVKLQQTIRHSLQLRDMLSDPNLVKVITGIKKLPSLPTLYFKLVKAMEDPEVSIKAIGEIIAQDITMTAKVLQLVNSAFYGLPTKVTNSQRAVIILGINTLKALVLSQHVFSQYQEQSNLPFPIDKLWQHSLAVSNLARTISHNVGAENQVMDDAQVAGMMHDIGKLIQLNVNNFYDDWGQLVRAGVPALEAEYRILGTSHAELGAYLLGIWGLPDSVVQAVAFHHMPNKQVDFQFSALTAVHAANGFLSPVRNKEGTLEYSLDMKYLKAMKCIEKVNSWVETYKQEQAILR